MTHVDDLNYTNFYAMVNNLKCIITLKIKVGIDFEKLLN